MTESRWQKWMKDHANSGASPMDLFNPYTERASEDLAEQRMEICRNCEHYIKMTHQCKECGCIMNLKTKLLHADCPLRKW